MQISFFDNRTFRLQAGQVDYAEAERIAREAAEAAEKAAAEAKYEAEQVVSVDSKHLRKFCV
jgi:hypothetical protein